MVMNLSPLAAFKVYLLFMVGWGFERFQRYIVLLFLIESETAYSDEVPQMYAHSA